MSRIQYVIWKDEYSVGIPELDAQHMKILDMIDDLYTATRSKENSSIIWESLTKLRDYTMTHLACEEKMLRDCGYPDLGIHVTAHDLLRRKTEELVRMLRLGTGGLSFDLLDFLKNWWTKHILGMDQKYVSCLLRRSS